MVWKEESRKDRQFPNIINYAVYETEIIVDKTVIIGVYL